MAAPRDILNSFFTPHLLGNDRPRCRRRRRCRHQYRSPAHTMTTATATSKRVMDLVASVCTLILATPVIAVAALLIKWDSPGPIFFRDERIGRGFLPFQIIIH